MKALEKLSHDYSHVLLKHGGLLAVLSYLDFFPTGVQRVAVVTAANICRGISISDSDAALAAVPMLTGLLQYSVGSQPFPPPDETLNPYLWRDPFLGHLSPPTVSMEGSIPWALVTPHCISISPTNGLLLQPIILACCLSGLQGRR